MNRIRIFVATLFLLAASTAGARTIEMDVNGLVCAFCAQGIEKTFKARPETEGVLVSLEHHLVAVKLRDGTDIDDASLRKTLADAGYTVVTIRRSERTLEQIREEPGRHD